jgi:uncharacterized repeat protein (TIGR02543 family)/LPXTG-motif cell wall-anchored protein
MRWLTVAVATAASLGAFMAGAAPANAAGATVTIGGVTYTATGSTDAAATGCDPTAGCGPDVPIQGAVTISGVEYPVTTIGYQAFANKQLTSVTIPSSVTTIDDYAFSGNLLTSVDIPDSVTTISGHAFYRNQLDAVRIPDSVTAVRDSAFSGNGMRSLVLGDSLTFIGANTFSDNGLATVTIPDSVTTVGTLSFDNNNLTSVVIGSSVTALNDYAFGRNQLTSVAIPDSVTTIGAHVFDQNRLTSVSLGNAVSTIGAYAFYSNQLTSVTIPSSVTSIGSLAFGSNLGLTDAVFQGAPPTGFAAAGDDGSFGVGTGVTVHFPTKYAADTVQGGFTTPTWQGYQAVPNPTVTFDTGADASPVASQNPDYNTPATTPADPTRSAFAFTGWFTAPVGGTAWDFSTPVTGDTTLYAQWYPRTPDAPTIGTATAGNASATVSFSPPADDGGAAVTAYTVTATDETNPANGGQSVTGTGSPITITGLTNGDTYTFTVTATNSVGVGVASAASNAVVPAAVVPAAPISPVHATAPGSLANTGSNPVGPLGVVGLLMLAGAGALVAARRHPRFSPESAHVGDNERTTR